MKDTRPVLVVGTPRHSSGGLTGYDYAARRTWRQQLVRRLYRIRQRAKIKGRQPSPVRLDLVTRLIAEIPAQSL